MTAFETLVDQSTPSVYRLARALVGEAGAADVVQEVFLAVWRELPRLRDPERFGPWLHRIAVNRCRSVLRVRGRVRELPLDDAPIDRMAEQADFRVKVEARAVVEPAFRSLSDDQRALIALHYAAGMSIREVALTLDIREGTAKSRLNAALEALRRSVGGRQ